jgi:hypothetical protein
MQQTCGNFVPFSIIIDGKGWKKLVNFCLGT